MTTAQIQGPILRSHSTTATATPIARTPRISRMGTINIWTSAILPLLWPERSQLEGVIAPRI